MEESKSNLYIVAIVGIIAVVALVVLVLDVGTTRQITSSNAGTGSDSAGQGYARAASKNACIQSGGAWSTGGSHDNMCYFPPTTDATYT